MSVKVKICGITNASDALMAAQAGADALGFIFWQKSPRFVNPKAVAGFARELPPHILKTGVFVNPTEELVAEAMNICGLNLLQFHGDEPPEFCLRFGIMTMKAFRVRGPESLAELQQYATDAWLLDAYTPGQPGGTGETFNWTLAREATGKGKPVFLAGGLTAENVSQAIAQARPFGVDVSSGVEERPGKKDVEKVKAFVKAAKAEGQG